MVYVTKALDIINWLNFATVTPSFGGGILTKERYMIDSSTWGVNPPSGYGIVYRPDCNIETAYALLRAWKNTGDQSYYTQATTIFNNILFMQNGDGSWNFFIQDSNDTIKHDIWTNDNAEVAIFLFRMSLIDTTNAVTYQNTALRTTNYLLGKQHSTGAFPVYSGDATDTALFTAQAVSALCNAYAYTSNKSGYKTAIEKALTYIGTQIQSDGRVLTSYEITSGKEEAWRPPSSDQSVVIRAFAHAEYFVTDSTQVSSWKVNRLNLLTWMNQLVDSSGAVKNGLGQNLTHADPPTVIITDHVYTTAFAMESYLYSYYVDNDQSYLDTVNKIANFVLGNMYYDSNSQADNGVVRGAYNITDQNWDTSAVSQNGGSEGGSMAVYSGWSNAPISSLFFELDEVSNTNVGWTKLGSSNGDTGTNAWLKLGNGSISSDKGWLKLSL